MSNVFRGYVKEFKECLDEARKRLSEGHQGDPNAARLAILDAEKFYRDADQIVRPNHRGLTPADRFHLAMPVFLQ